MFMLHESIFFDKSREKIGTEKKQICTKEKSKLVVIFCF